MTLTEAKDTIKNVINTLNTVEVKGRDNLNHLLGCILALEQVAGNIDAPTPEIKLEEVAQDEEH